MKLESLGDVHPWSGGAHPPASDQLVELDGDGRLGVPSTVTVPFIEGDGIGPEITPAMIHVVDRAVKAAYGGARAIVWVEVLAGGKAERSVGERLPAETLEMLRQAVVGIKGPLGTPVGRGARSLNALLRQGLDFYSALRPVYWLGQPTPIPDPGRLDLTVFRENSDDVYMAIEYFAGSEDTARVGDFLRREMGVPEAKLPADCGITVKPMSEAKTKRHVRKGLRYALDMGKTSVALVGKGNIMKATEGAFIEWGFEVAREPEFAERVVVEGEPGEGQVRLSKMITDQMLMQLVLRPDAFDVAITQNLNGDYLSDLAAALMGGPGFVPSGNIGDGYALFESTHGTAEDIAGRAICNPLSLILSGGMLLDYLGWREAAGSLVAAVRQALSDRLGTPDLVAAFGRAGEQAHRLSTSEFAREIGERVPSSGAKEIQE